jgi:hypothetical protein
MRLGQFFQKVAFDWQTISVWADFWELAAPQVQHGRSHDLAGCMANGGERLALTLAAVSEAELWRIYRQDIPPEVRQLDGRPIFRCVIVPRTE